MRKGGERELWKRQYFEFMGGLKVETKETDQM